jgi:hypothetical protein
MTMWVISRIFFSLIANGMGFKHEILLSPFYDELFPFGIVEGIGNGKDVLVAPAGLVDEDDVVS